jgi:hypothetical protein
MAIRTGALKIKRAREMQIAHRDAGDAGQRQSVGQKSGVSIRLNRSRTRTYFATPGFPVNFPASLHNG